MYQDLYSVSQQLSSNQWVHMSTHKLESSIKENLGLFVWLAYQVHKRRNTGFLSKITEFTLTLNIENDRIKILRWENSYFDHFLNEETINYTVGIWRSCHHNFLLVFSFFLLFILVTLKHLFQVWWILCTFRIS